MHQERKCGATPELIPLMTARLSVFAESEKKEKLNAVRVKSLTGNDDISARALYGNQVTFRPKCKIVMLTNHKPEFDISDQAMLDRLKLIPLISSTVRKKQGQQGLR
jgi:putative DNA primase/helicase